MALESGLTAGVSAARGFLRVGCMRWLGRASSPSLSLFLNSFRGCIRQMTSRNHVWRERANPSNPGKRDVAFTFI